LIVETSKPTPKLHIFTNEKVDNKTFNADEFVKEWIEKMTKQAENSVSQGAYEKGMQPFREDYIKELQQISTDVVLQAQIDEAENTLKKQITNRRK
jgi:maltodextrin utilization protein YvdJ